MIEAFKTAGRECLIHLCAAANLAEPEVLADELFLLLEGARVTAQSVGPKGLGDRLARMGEAMIKAHTIIAPEKIPSIELPMTEPMHRCRSSELDN